MNLYELYPHSETRTNRIRKSLVNLTPEHLSFRHREDMRSLGNLYRHIIAAEIYWMKNVVGGTGKKYEEIPNEALPDAKSILDKLHVVEHEIHHSGSKPRIQF